MKLGILETGPVAAELVPLHGEYGQIITDFLHRADPTIQTFAVAVHTGAALPQVSDADGWIISGSKHGAYDDLPWIAPLEAFLRAAMAAKIPLAGICFGHQILAQAMGGTVVKSPKGWGLGVGPYQMTARPDWMEGVSDSFTAAAVHQDQVIAPPPGTHVLARSEFCPVAALAYGDVNAPDAITIQPHPEFEPDFMRGLLELRRAHAFPVDRTDAALTQLQTPNHNRDWARWMVKFFQTRIG